MIARRFHFDETSFFHLLNALRAVSGSMFGYNSDFQALAAALSAEFGRTETELKAKTEEIAHKAELVRRALAARGGARSRSSRGEGSNEQNEAETAKTEAERLSACADTLAECRNALRTELAAVTAAHAAFENGVRRACTSMTQAAESMRFFCRVFETSFRYAAETLELRPEAGTDGGALARTMQLSPVPRFSGNKQKPVPSAGGGRKTSVKDRCLGEIADGAQTVKIPAHAFGEMGGKAFFDGLEGYRVLLFEGSMIGPDGTITLEKI